MEVFKDTSSRDAHECEWLLRMIITASNNGGFNKVTYKIDLRTNTIIDSSDITTRFRKTSDILINQNFVYEQTKDSFHRCFKLVLLYPTYKGIWFNYLLENNLKDK